VRVLVAIDAFGASLGAVQAAAALARGWAQGAPHDDVTQLPLSSGGPGFLDVIDRVVRGTTVATTVDDPLGRAVPAAVLVVDDGPRRTAYLEASQASGLHLLAANERDPTRTSSWGVGQLLQAAVDSGADRVVVAVDGDATNDAGAGLLAALGAGPASALAHGGLVLRDAPDDAVCRLGSVVDRFSGIDLVLATEDATPLLGLRGTSALGAPGKGASSDQAQELEGALGRFAEIVRRSLPSAPVDLLSGMPRRVEREPGAGAGGGLGYALLMLGARRVSAVAEVLRICRFDELVRATDLVVTGTGVLDWAALRDSVVTGVASAAAPIGRPVIVVAGECQVGRRETMAAGFAGSYAVAEGAVDVAALVADPVASLVARMARVARTWSPRR
jgi:glycerate 2-kinase